MNKYGNLEAVIWDMDGVIIDSRLAHFESFQIILGKYGWKVREDFFMNTFGMPNDQTIQLVTDNAIDASEIERISIEKDRKFCELINEQAKFIAGVEYWLKQFKQDGVKQALASSGSWENINTILDALNARQYFGAVISGEDSVGKPDPSVFLLAAEGLGVSPDKCLVIEDSEAGLQAAESARMKILAVTTTNPPEKLAKADLILNNLTNLHEWQVAELF